MSFPNRQIDATKRFISKYGQTVIWKQLSDGIPPDPAKPWKPGPNVEVENKVKICFVAETDTTFKKFLSYLNGTNIPSGKDTGLMAQVNFEPKIKDVVVRGDEEYTVRDFKLIAPNGTPILYIIEFDS